MTSDDETHSTTAGLGQRPADRSSGCDDGLPPDPLRAKDIRAADAPVTGSVVRLFDVDPQNPDRVVAEMRGYWQGLRRGMSIPTRADIEPDGMRGTLDFAFILERIAPGAARFRLAGRHLIDVMGMEVRGMPICAFFNPAARGHLSDLLETVFQGPQMLELTLHSAGDYGRPALGARLLLLPLRSDLGDVTRALGCLVVEGEIGRAPRRFDIEGHAIEPVIPGARILAPASGFAETAEPWRSERPRNAIPAADPKAGRRRPAATGKATLPPLHPSAAAPTPSPEERRAGFRVISRD